MTRLGWKLVLPKLKIHSALSDLSLTQAALLFPPAEASSASAFRVMSASRSATTRALRQLPAQARPIEGFCDLPQFVCRGDRSAVWRRTTKVIDLLWYLLATSRM